MTAVLRQDAVPAASMHLLRNMLEEQFAVHTARLTELTVYGRLTAHRRQDRQELERLAEAARQGIADTAHALQRMSQGTYGICEGCERPIPYGRLRTMPHATRCGRCPQD